MHTRQEQNLRKVMESLVLNIALACEPESPHVMTDADKVSVLLPQVRAQLQAALDENAIGDEHVLDNLNARKAQATGTEADELQAVIDLYSS